MNRKGRNSGAALIICLMLLIALSVLAFSMFSSQRMSALLNSNSEIRQNDYRIALRTLVWAEHWLMSIAGDQNPDSCEPPCSNAATIFASGLSNTDPLRLGSDWWQEHGFREQLNPITGESGSNSPDLYSGLWAIEPVHKETIIDSSGEAVNVAWYRILARGPLDGDKQSMLVESIFARPWGLAEWHDQLNQSRDIKRFCASLIENIPCGRVAWQRHL